LGFKRQLVRDGGNCYVISLREASAKRKPGIFSKVRLCYDRRRNKEQDDVDEER